MYGCIACVTLRRRQHTSLFLLFLLALLAPMTQALPVQLDPGRPRVRTDSHSNGRHRHASNDFSKLVMLRSDSTDRLLQVLPGGDINALATGHLTANPNKYAALIMKSVEGADFGSVTIISNRTKEYLCYTQSGRLVMRAIPRKHCTFIEKELTIRGETIFQYSMSIPATPSGREAQTFYLAFRSNGKKLRGNKWQESQKFEECTYFRKEQEKHSHLVSSQDPYAPNVDLDKHWKEYMSSREGQRRSRGHELDRGQPEVVNDNAQWAPRLTNQKKQASKLVNPADGHVIRHGRHRGRGNT